MDPGKASKVVGVSMVLTVTVGVLNSLAKEEKLPSARFIVGSGVVWMVLSGLADVEPEIAAPLSIAILTTSLFSKEPGVLEFLNKRGEVTPTTPDNTAAAKRKELTATTAKHRITVAPMSNPKGVN